MHVLLIEDDLDLTLPDCDGMALLAQWRRQSTLGPVIVMAARQGLSDRLAPPLPTVGGM
jgi:DNA-binding response OmpR family regulator